MDVFSGQRARARGGDGAAVSAACRTAARGYREAGGATRPGGRREASPAAACGRTGGERAAGGCGGGAVPRGVVSGSRARGGEPWRWVGGAVRLPQGGAPAHGRGGVATHLGRPSGLPADRAPGAT